MTRAEAQALLRALPAEINAARASGDRAGVNAGFATATLLHAIIAQPDSESVPESVLATVERILTSA